MEKEEGEMTDEDECMEVDADIDISEVISAGDNEVYTVLNRPEADRFLIAPSDKADVEKLEKRAKRLGLDLSRDKIEIQSEINALYENLKVNDANERHIRFDTLHLKGVEGLLTKEIFEYLEDFQPISLEWVTNISCNVVFQDHITAALALFIHSKVYDGENITKKGQISWRKGLPHSKNESILFRFATKSDKKDLSAQTRRGSSDLRRKIPKPENSLTKNPWGDLCMTWGIHDHQEFYVPRAPPKNIVKTESGIVTKNKSLEFDIDDFRKLPIKSKLAGRLGKRPKHSNESSESSSGDEWCKKRKAPRMRMHADDEEEKSKPTKEKDGADDINKESLLIEIDNSAPVQNIRSRLGHIIQSKQKSLDRKQSSVRDRLGGERRQNILSDASSENCSDTRSESSASDSSASEDSYKAQKRLPSVWQRLDSKSQNRNEGVKSKIMKSTVTDLRHRLREKDDVRNRSPLRIEIDNDYYNDSE